MTFKRKAAADAAPKSVCAVHRPAAAKWTAGQRRTFIEHLGMSSNVTASAKMAGISSTSIYRERARNEKFRKAWHRALCEGYARLEADLLAEALIGVSAKTSDITLKSRAQKYRLGLTLLSAHRASVRGGDTAPVTARTTTVRQRLELRFATMRERMGDDDAK
jgi:hypothetical protein